MNDPSESVRLLMAEIAKTRGLLAEIDVFYRSVQVNELASLGRSRSAALIVAQIFENYYTCLETCFLRISQFFENNLSHDRWHSDLLEKMTLNVPGIRHAAIQTETYGCLEEFLRFRHFKRYYFQLDYDWEKIDFLAKKYEQAYPAVQRDLDAFLEFLEEI
jgi:hypothetical protein